MAPPSVVVILTRSSSTKYMIRKTNNPTNPHVSTKLAQLFELYRGRVSDNTSSWNIPCPPTDLRKPKYVINETVATRCINESPYILTYWLIFTQPIYTDTFSSCFVSEIYKLVTPSLPTENNLRKPTCSIMWNNSWNLWIPELNILTNSTNKHVYT